MQSNWAVRLISSSYPLQEVHTKNARATALIGLISNIRPNVLKTSSAFILVFTYYIYLCASYTPSLRHKNALALYYLRAKLN